MELAPLKTYFLDLVARTLKQLLLSVLQTVTRAMAAVHVHRYFGGNLARNCCRLNNSHFYKLKISGPIMYSC